MNLNPHSLICKLKGPGGMLGQQTEKIDLAKAWLQTGYLSYSCINFCVRQPHFLLEVGLGDSPRHFIGYEMAGALVIFYSQMFMY